MEITYGLGGWVSVANIGLPGLLYLRYTIQGEIGELVLPSDTGPITAAHLRRLPLTAITNVVMARPDLFLMGDRALVPDIHAQMHQIVPRRRARSHPSKARLSPPRAGLTPEFLQEVANAYTAAVARGERPNKALAEQVGHDNSRTVERWVYLARKRGLLPSTRSVTGTGAGSLSVTGSGDGAAVRAEKSQ